MSDADLLGRALRRWAPTLEHRLIAARLANGIRMLSPDERPAPAAAPTRAPDRLLLVPSDPRTLVGARGDEAMIGAVIGRLRSAQPALRVMAVVGSPLSSQAAHELGLEPVELWEPFKLQRAAGVIGGFDPDCALMIGADVMDGHYSVPNTLRRLALMELAARHGARAAVTGFSFNEHPAPALGGVLRRLGGRVRFNVRDPISLGRFTRFCGAPAELVADVAFLLAPAPQAPAIAPVLRWVDERRAAGDRIVVFNIHPQLGERPEQAEALVALAGQLLAPLAARLGLSWLLLPHDFRGPRGDNRCLAPLADQLRGLGPRLLHAAGPFNAAELKAIAGRADAVLTGRMHLAIAALGGGVATAALTYQGKFDGLWQHFGLDPALLLAPAQALMPGRLEALLVRLVEAAGPLAQQVRQHLPGVRALAERNFTGLLP